MYTIAIKRFVFAAGLLAAGTAASAAALYFTDAGGPRTWDDGTTLNWADTAGGNPAGTYGLAWVGGSDAHFEGTPGTVNIGAGGISSVSSITFDVDGYALGGTGAANTITLTGFGGNITTGAGVDAITAVLGGTVGLTKLGTGTLQLSAANTYTGATAVNAGILEIGTGGSINTASAINVTTGGTLKISGGSVTTNSAPYFLLADGGSLNMSSGSFTSTTSGYLVIGDTGTNQWTQTGGTTSITAGSSIYVANTAASPLTNVTMDISGGTFTGNAQLSLGIRGNANLNISNTAVVTFPSIQMNQVSNGQTSAINLGDGANFTGGPNIGAGGTSGVLAVGRVYASFGASSFNFKGGTLKATASSAVFFEGLGAANVMEAGGVIDNNGFNITVAQSLAHGGAGADGGLIFKGAGTTTLTGANSYNGGTVIQNGALVVGHANALGTTGTIANNATLGIASGVTFARTVSWGASSTLAGSGTYAPGGTFTAGGTGNCTTLSPGLGGVGTLTIGNDLALNNAALTYDVVAASADQIAVAGSLALAGTNTFNFTSPPLAGTYTVMTYTGGLTGNASALTSNLTPANFNIRGYAAAFSTATANQINMTVSDAHADLVWTGGDGNWDLNATPNWSIGGAPGAVFYNRDKVLFDDTASNGSVVQVGALLPGSVVVDNSDIHDYTFSGAGIGGTTSLVKQYTGTGTPGTLIIANANSFTGPTTINAGTLQIGTGGAGAASGSIDNTSKITIAAGATLLYFRSDANIALPWAKLDGAGTFYFKGVNNPTNAAPLNSYSASNGGATSVPSSFTGTIVVENARINPNTTDAYGGTSRIVIKPNGGILVSVAGTFPPIPITIEGQGWSETAGTPPTLATGGTMRFLNGATWSGNITLAGDARITPTNNSTGFITGNIDGGSYELEVGYGGSLGAGTLTLAPNTANVLAKVKVSPDATLAAGNINAFGAGGAGCPVVMNGGNLNLNGFNLTFANLTNTGLYGTVRNGGAVPATVSIGADGTDSEYGGTLADGGPAALSVKKTGVGTLTLSGTNTYSGDTIVENGILKVGFGAIPYDVGKGNVVLDGGATAGILDINDANPPINALIGAAGTILGKVVNNGYGLSMLQVGMGDASGTFAGVIADNTNGGSGKLALRKTGMNGTGTQILAGTNTYTGPTTVANGKLLVNGSLAAGSAVAVESGAILGGIGTINGATTVEAGGIVEAGQSSGDSLTFAGGLSLGNYSYETVIIDLGPAANYVGTAAIKVPGVNALVANPNPGSGGAVRINIGGSTMATGNYKLLNYSGAIGGSGFAAFQLGAYPSVGARGSVALVNNPGEIALSVTVGSVYWTGLVNANWTLTSIGGAQNWKYLGSGTEFLAGDKVIFDDSATGTTINIYNADVTPGSVNFSGTKSFTLQGAYAIAGDTDLTVNGSGILTINNANTYTGNTLIAAGTVKIGNALALPSGYGKAAITVNGALDLNGNSIAVNSLSGSGTVTSGASGSMTFTNTDNGNYPYPNSTFSGVIQDGSGTVALASTTYGTLKLAGVNTYSGPTTVANGTLQIGVANALPHGAGKGDVAVENSASLDLNGFTATVNGLTGAGIVTNSNNAATGTLAIGDNDASTTFAGVMQNGAGITALEKIGAGTLTLTNASTYSGPTTITSGILQVGLGDTGAGTGNLANTSSFSIAGGATLKYFKITNNIVPGAKLNGSGTFHYQGANSQANPNPTSLSYSSVAGVPGTFTGTFVVEGARINPANATALGGASMIEIKVNGQFATYSFPANSVFSKPLTISQNGPLEGWYEAAGTYGSIRLQGTNITLAGNITLNNYARIVPVSASTITGRIVGGAGSVLEVGSLALGTQVLTLSPAAENAFSQLIPNGSAWVSAGNANAYPSATPAVLTMSGGGLRLNGSNFTFAKLEQTGQTGLYSATGTIGNYHATTAATITVGTEGSSTVFGGIIRNGGNAPLALIKGGGGTLTLTGLLEYTGNTTISGGTMQIGNLTPATLKTVNLTTFTGTGALSVSEGVKLNAGSIHVGSLSIGGPLVSAAAAVPEPSAMILSIFAALGIWVLRKRMK